MAENLKILGISGSLRQGSYNTGALRAAVELAPAGVEIEVYDISGFPEFNQDQDQDPPKKVTEFKRKIREADAILFCSPEYNYSVPGVLKNAIDWASRPYGDSAWEGKPAAVMGASIGGIGTARMQYHLRQIMVFLNMFPVNRPEVMISNCSDKYDEQGNLKDEETKKYIGQLIESLADWTRKLKGSGQSAAQGG
jgi:chromate reductase, NAD(P)H dehydrogenase (quinone)